MFIFYILTLANPKLPSRWILNQSKGENNIFNIKIVFLIYLKTMAITMDLNFSYLKKKENMSFFNEVGESQNFPKGL